MSRIIPLRLLAVTLAFVLLVSCSSQNDDKLSHTFESAFAVTLTVNNAQTEYCARITVSAITLSDSGEPLTVRDGSVQYISPDSISDIYARRTDSTVVVGLGGIEITPSPDIAAKYVRLLDMLDIRSESFRSAGKVRIDGVELVEAVFTCGAGDVTVLFDAETQLPISATCNEIQIRFSEFTYL